MCHVRALSIQTHVKFSLNLETVLVIEACKEYNAQTIQVYDERIDLFERIIDQKSGGGGGGGSIWIWRRNKAFYICFTVSTKGGGCHMKSCELFEEMKIKKERTRKINAQHIVSGLLAWLGQSS